MQQVRQSHKPLSPVAPFHRPIYLFVPPLRSGVQLLRGAVCPPRAHLQILRGCGYSKIKRTAVVAVLLVEHTRVELVTF